MTKPTSFKVTQDDRGEGYDFVIGGVLLKDRLRKHEGATLDHVSALGTVEGARARLLLAREPDLSNGVTALFVCGLCGGYDGNPIGARIRLEGDRVVWEALGHHFDHDGVEPILFVRVNSFSFDWSEYNQALLAIPAS